MRILLLDPPNHALARTGFSVQTHPLGLGYVAAALAPHHDVAQIVPDARPFQATEDVWGTILQAAADYNPQLIGITAVTATFPSARTLATRLRAVLPEVPIVLGGVHVSFKPEDGLAIPAVDWVVRGEGEQAMVEIAAALEAGRSPEGTAGVSGRRADGTIWRGPPRPPIKDLDGLAPPRRDGVLWAEHLQPAFYQSIITLRGCPYTCIYCSVPASSERQTRYRSADNITDEIAMLVDRYRVPYLFFHDSVFTLHRRRTLALLDGLAARGLRVPFACQTRTDRVDPELLDRLAQGGCHQIFFGIESGHPESLAKMHKATPLSEIRAAVSEVRRRGIRCTGFFMVGFPWETEEHLDTTADFATDLGLDAVSLFSATPLPGTALWDLWTAPLPDAIDFRAPQVNLTRLPDAEYAARFLAVKARVEAYNQTTMLAGVMGHWPRG